MSLDFSKFVCRIIFETRKSIPPSKQVIDGGYQFSNDKLELIFNSVRQGPSGILHFPRQHQTGVYSLAHCKAAIRSAIRPL